MGYYQKSENHHPDIELDLHGHTTLEARVLLDDLFEDMDWNCARIVVGKGTRSEFGPVMPAFVENYLNDQRVSFSYASSREGGRGALDVVRMT
jgi:DNA-nicking Smr family endonuclease